MPGCRPLLAGVLLLSSSAYVPLLRAQAPGAASTPQPPRITTIRLVGANQLSQQDTLEGAHLQVGEPLAEDVRTIEKRIERYYVSEGYTFARANATLDEASGVLTVAIDEGLIDAVEFRGVDERIQRELAADFALRAGDVYNSGRARQALRALLRPTRGALEPGDTPFDLVDRNGQRVLRVAVDERRGRFRVSPDLGEREDWFTPVDGFVPSLGVGVAIFDHERFNHSYASGHLSFKTATDRAGYAFGFERPFFAGQRLYLGAEVYDLTSTDDSWQVSPIEASLAAIGPRRSFRDYYRRRGVQLNGAWRLQRRVELLFAWRGERQQGAPVRTDFSFWNSDEAFRPNVASRDGRLNALVLGASVDCDGFDAESLGATYRRHQLNASFGDRLNTPPRNRRWPMWRVNWTSEISTPDTLGGDFDFRRHIVSVRARQTSRHQEIGLRVIGGWSDGVLPPQRTFALGGIGSVHGYQFKEAVGDAMVLGNLEYAVGKGHNLQLIGFLDAGRVTTRSRQLGAPSQESPWMKGAGFGIAIGDAIRIDFGYKLAAIPSSPQVLVRFDRTF